MAHGKQWLTIRDIMREADISKSSAERCLKAGWLPPPDRNVQQAAGGTAQREWLRATVTTFIAACKRARAHNLALREVFGDSRE